MQSICYFYSLKYCCTVFRLYSWNKIHYVSLAPYASHHRIPTAIYKEVGNTSQERREILEDLGYDLVDYHLCSCSSRGCSIVRCAGWLSFHNDKERIYTISLLFLSSLMLLYPLLCILEI